MNNFRYSDDQRKEYDFLSQNEDYVKFVILGSPRVGSTFLLSALNSHTDVLAYGEIFDTKHFLTDLRDPLHYPLLTNETADYFEQLKYEDPKLFLDAYIYRKYHSDLIKAIGFKLFYVQPEKVYSRNQTLDYLASDKRIKIIHIKRKNLLSSFISLKIALQTNRWANYGMIEEPEINPVFLDYESCLEEFEEVETQQVLFENKLKDNDIFTLFYEDLITDPQSYYQELQTFLGLKHQKLYTYLKKQQTKRLSDIILNYADLKKSFSSTKWASFFDE